MNRLKRIDELNKEITATIFEVREAHGKLSRLEEEMANLTSPCSVEGRVSRRGAVRAAIESGNEERARKLVEQFSTEDLADKRLKNELQALLTK